MHQDDPLHDTADRLAFAAPLASRARTAPVAAGEDATTMAATASGAASAAAARAEGFLTRYPVALTAVPPRVSFWLRGHDAFQAPLVDACPSGLAGGRTRRSGREPDAMAAVPCWPAGGGR